MADETDQGGARVSRSELVGAVADVASAFLANPSSRVSIDELPKVIANVHKSLLEIYAPGGPGATSPVQEGAAALPPSPAVPVKKSVFPDRIVCLECGGSFVALTRHLKIVHSLTADQYREKWSLPADYPVVAPDYSKHRSKLARELGFGGERDAQQPDAGS